MSRLIDLLERQHADVLARIDRDVDRFADFATVRAFVAFLDAEVVGHFRLEEELLFPSLRLLPGLADGPLRVMDAEHAAFRELLSVGKNALDAGVAEPATLAAGDLAALLRGHIAKESGVLFPMALELLTTDHLDRIDAGLGPRRSPAR